MPVLDDGLVKRGILAFPLEAFGPRRRKSFDRISLDPHARCSGDPLDWYLARIRNKVVEFFIPSANDL